MAKALGKLRHEPYDAHDTGPLEASLEFIPSFILHVSSEDPAYALQPQIIDFPDDPFEAAPAIFRNAVFTLWTQRDMDAATAFYQSIDPEKNLVTASVLSSILVRTMAHDDPESALRWAGKLPDALRGSSIQDIFSVWSKISPEQAALRFGTLAGVDDDRELATIASMIADNWAKTEPTEALEWIKTLTPENQRFALAKAIGRLAGKDFSLAKAEVMNAPSAWRPKLLQMLSHSIPPGQAEDFSVLLDHLPDEESKVGVVGGITNSWTQHDPISASFWVSRLPKGAIRQEAIERFYGTLVSMDLARVMEWAVTISEDPQIAQWIFESIPRKQRLLREHLVLPLTLADDVERLERRKQMQRDRDPFSPEFMPEE